jgi:hypothetical protein
MTLVSDVKVSDTVSIAEVRAGSYRQFEVRCSACPTVEIREHRVFAESIARQHVCPEPASDVADRIGRIWRQACESYDSKALRGVDGRIFAEACNLIAEYGVPVSAEQGRMLRWLAGFEHTTVIAFVELIVSGRERVTS